MANKQFSSRTIMMITIAVAIVLTVIIWPLSMIGKGDPSSASGDEAELRIQPVARVEMKKAAPASDGKARDAASIYNGVCVACHGTGAAGAPKTGDKAAWAPRIAQGMETLLKNATNGKGAMPPKGGAADLSDAELKSVVDYLVSQAK
ncbi:c-type cytochrome [Propionivibrio soli]|uniref:c-type cytochrome n=1 Tax=Propionivibrio soli TaxID=2976531 RepID=UPI0021E77AD6|nr:c-type cytochrome [Propionivibrio soli]